MLTVSQASVKAGSRITVSGKNFSGCTVQGTSTKPTPVLPVKVGVVNAAKQTKVLATTKTSSDGSFSVKVTIPSISTEGKGKIAVIAASMDPATKLDYAGVRAIAYQAGTPTSPPAKPSMPSQVPTAVPAGSGGLGTPSTPARYGVELGLGAAGVALLAMGALGLKRRRTGQYR